MEINVEQRDSLVVLSPSGDVDLSSSKDLQQAVRQTMNKKPARVVVDLAGVPYMDSSGVATLVEAMQIARKQSTELVLACMQAKVRSIFEIARLDRVFTIVDAVEDA
jgi:anti-sigma B factor antagonist